MNQEVEEALKTISDVVSDYLDRQGFISTLLPIDAASTRRDLWGHGFDALDQVELKSEIAGVLDYGVPEWDDHGMTLGRYTALCSAHVPG
ncbi:MAG TPA: hypothetical protein VJJ47_01130 [Candidatus Paceibacterota bacterium]